MPRKLHAYNYFSLCNPSRFSKLKIFRNRNSELYFPVVMNISIIPKSPRKSDVKIKKEPSLFDNDYVVASIVAVFLCLYFIKLIKNQKSQFTHFWYYHVYMYGFTISTGVFYTILKIKLQSLVVALIIIKCYIFIFDFLNFFIRITVFLQFLILCFNLKKRLANLVSCIFILISVLGQYYFKSSKFQLEPVNSRHCIVLKPYAFFLKTILYRRNCRSIQ